MFRLLAAIFIFFIYFTHANSQDFDSAMASIAQDHNLVGVVAIAQCGSDELASYYGGLANVSNADPIDSETMFRIASISKLVSALGFMRLYDQGLIALDDDISSSLGYEVRNPSFPDVPITYRMVLSHTSSIQDGSGYSPFLGATYNSNPIPSISEVLLEEGDFHTSNIWRTEAPGSFFAYSNLNFGLIGTLIEAISGQRFDQFMEQEVLNPLGIAGGFNVGELENIENLAVLYRDNIPQWDNYNGLNPDPIVDETYLPGTNGSLFAPQGGLRCSAKDLLNIAEMLTNQGTYNGIEFLSPASVEEMLNSQWEYDGSNGDNYFGLFNNWGLGVHRAGNNGYGDQVIENIQMVGHPGEAYGLISDLYFDENSGLSLVFITNGYSSGGGYEFGAETVFYAPEEETFELISQTFLQECQTLNNTSNEAPAPCEDLVAFNDLSELIQSSIHPEKEMEILSMEGKSIRTYNQNSADLSIEIPPGIYILKLKSEKETCVQKIAISR